MRTSRLLAVLLGLGTVQQAVAATVTCVDSVATLQAALSAAENNADDDYINVHWGVYSLSSELLHSSSENRILSIVGGYDDGCNSVIGNSMLDGNDAVRPLSIFVTGGSVSIRRMYFADGFANGAGGGLQLVATSANIILDKNRFSGNRSEYPCWVLNERMADTRSISRVPARRLSVHHSSVLPTQDALRSSALGSRVRCNEGCFSKGR